MDQLVKHRQLLETLHARAIGVNADTTWLDSAVRDLMSAPSPGDPESEHLDALTRLETARCLVRTQRRWDALRVLASARTDDSAVQTRLTCNRANLYVVTGDPGHALEVLAAHASLVRTASLGDQATYWSRVAQSWANVGCSGLAGAAVKRARAACSDVADVRLVADIYYVAVDVAISAGPDADLLDELGRLQRRAALEVTASSESAAGACAEASARHAELARRGGQSAEALRVVENALAKGWGGASASTHALAALLAALNGDGRGALDAARAAIALGPDVAAAVAIARRIGIEFSDGKARQTAVTSTLEFARNERIEQMCAHMEFERELVARGPRPKRDVVLEWAAFCSLRLRPDGTAVVALSKLACALGRDSAGADQAMLARLGAVCRIGDLFVPSNWLRDPSKQDAARVVRANDASLLTAAAGVDGAYATVAEAFEQNGSGPLQVVRRACQAAADAMAWSTADDDPEAELFEVARRLGAFAALRPSPDAAQCLAEIIGADTVAPGLTAAQSTLVRAVTMPDLM